MVYDLHVFYSESMTFISLMNFFLSVVNLWLFDKGTLCCCIESQEAFGIWGWWAQRAGCGIASIHWSSTNATGRRVWLCTIARPTTSTRCSASAWAFACQGHITCIRTIWSFLATTASIWWPIHTSVSSASFAQLFINLMMVNCLWSCCCSVVLWLPPLQ